MRFEVDACFVISLAKRFDRLEALAARMPDPWPLPRPCLFPAVDGRAEPRPKWWKATPGAWGCYRSHVELLECCLEESIERVLILEDDVTFSKEFTAAVQGLEVPDDCQQLYLGGQHLAHAEVGPPGFMIGRNVNRTHAYAVFGRATIELLLEHLRPEPERWTSKHHVDHHYGILHRERRIRVYAVQPWICGQRGGRSDVGTSFVGERWWRC